MRFTKVKQDRSPRDTMGVVAHVGDEMGGFITRCGLCCRVVSEVWLSVGYGHLLETPLWGCVGILVYQSLWEARFGAGTQQLADLG